MAEGFRKFCDTVAATASVIALAAVTAPIFRRAVPFKVSSEPIGLRRLSTTLDWSTTSTTAGYRYCFLGYPTFTQGLASCEEVRGE